MSNTIIITGRLAVDPELKYANSGKALCNVVVPDQKRRKNDAGEWEDASATTWFRATLFDEEAEEFANTVKKGDTIVMTGRLITREYQGKDGDTRSSLEVDYVSVGVTPKASTQSGGYGSRPTGTTTPDPWGGQPSQQPAQGGGWQQPGQQSGYGETPPF